MQTQPDLASLVQRLNQEPATAKLYLIQRRRRTDRFRYQVCRTEVTPAISQELISILTRNLAHLAADPELECVAYSPSFTPENHLQVCALADVQYAVEIMEQMADETQLPFPAVDPSFLRSLWAYAVQIRHSAGSCTYFCKYAPGKVLARGGLLKLIYTSDGHFEKLDGDLFQISDTVDCVVIGETILVCRERPFEAIFSYADLLASSVESYVAEPTFQRYFAPAELKAFASQVSNDMRKIRKLHTICSANLLTRMDRSKAKLRAEQLGLTIQFDEQTGQVILDGTNLWHLLRLLDEDYLTSDVTGITYEVTSKREREKKTG